MAAVMMEDLLFNAIEDADTPEVGIQNWLIKAGRANHEFVPV